MVFMADSERAATVARAHGLPAGLHLNFTQLYDGAEVPRAVAERQARVVRYMSGRRRRRLGLAPHLVGTVRAAVQDQIERFRELYGGEPTHLDGHNHVHLNPTILALLPDAYALRPAYDPITARPVLRTIRRARNRMLKRRHPTVDNFFPLTSIHPELGGRGLEQVLELALERSVEVMVHPAEDRVLAVLRSPQWREELAERRLGTYRDLVSRRQAAPGSNA